MLGHYIIRTGSRDSPYGDGDLVGNGYNGNGCGYDIMFRSYTSGDGSQYYYNDTRRILNRVSWSLTC